MKTFQQRLEGMLNKIKYDRENINFRNTAKYWGTPKNDDKYVDKILDKLFEKDFEFSERREQEIKVTIEEMLLNSYSKGCHERNDLYVECIVYLGEKGIVMHVKDDGPGFDHKKKIRESKAKKDKLTDDVLLYSTEDSLGGTGIQCLLRYPDAFQYNKEGNQVAIRFDLSK